MVKDSILRAAPQEFVVDIQSFRYVSSRIAVDGRKNLKNRVPCGDNILKFRS